ncbi:hypothetical protein Tco_1370179 [Tanacetum coccineum]
MQLSFAMISLSKKRRLVAELDALVFRGESAKPLEYMREVVARDSALLEDLKKTIGAFSGRMLYFKCRNLQGVRIALQQSVGTSYVRYVELCVYAAVVIFLTVNEARASDEELEAPMEDQPLPADASPTAQSSGYIANFDPEEDEEDPEEDPADHPVNEGDNDDNESSDDDDNDDDVVKDEEKEEEHLALADPSVVLTYDLVPSS